MKISLNKITVNILKENKEDANVFMSLAEIRNKAEQVARQDDEEASFSLQETKDALANAEKALAKEKESLAIERGHRNKKLSWRIAEPEDKGLIQQTLDIRLTLSKSNGDNMMNLEVIGFGNDILDEKSAFKNALQDFFMKVKQLK